MKSVIGLQLGPNHTDLARTKVRAVTQVRAHGTQRIPDLPRGLVVHPGAGGALITWHLPLRYDDVTGYRIYLGTEKNLAVQIRDRGTRQVFVPLTGGATPPLNNIFVSVVNGFRESGRVQVQTAAQPDAGTTTPPATTPTVPQPTPDFLNQFSGGFDKTQSGQPTGKRTP